MNITLANSPSPLSETVYPFIQSCEDLLVTAARDLAVLTKYGVGAPRIVSLSNKCDSIKQMAQETKKRKKIEALCKEVLLGLGDICWKVERIQSHGIQKADYQSFAVKIDSWWIQLGAVR